MSLIFVRFCSFMSKVTQHYPALKEKLFFIYDARLFLSLKICARIFFMIDKLEILREYNFQKLGLRLVKIVKINHGTI